MSRRKNNQDINVLLPETVITPNGSYTQFTGGEDFIPSLDYFKELEINKDRVNAVNRMLTLEAPVDPHNPSMSYPSAALGVFGMSDDTRNYIFGNDNKRRTCLYTASSQYNDTPVASNRQFAANPEKYGFKEVDVKDAGVGDIVQFWENGKVPHHATVYTGNTPEGEPLISYSNGNTEAYREWKYPNGEYEVRGNIIKNRNISDGPVQDLGTQHYYRYIGSPQKHEQIERRYEMLKNGEHIYKDGGFFHPKDAWDELPLAEKAEMMEVAVRNGITNLQEIKKKYNEFADGGNFNSLPDNWTMEDESAYRQWLSNLPDNLKSTDDSVYDMRRAFKAGMVPVLNEDGYYHLGSRDPQTGRILKAPIHPTYLQAITEDARMGYYPTINDKGVTYTNTWKGNQFKGGGYTSSDSIRSRIAKYEGKAMTGAIDPLSGKWDKNRSFEAEDASFYAALPESIRGKVLANPDLADNLYSYSYNVGAGNFKKRVVPALERYYQGKATVGDIERSMWASGDAKLRGLRTRRAEERAGVRAALDPTKPIIERPVSTTVFNPYALQQQNTVQLPQYIPSETEYIRTIEVSPEQQRAIQLQERFDQINRFNQLMKLAGIENTAIPAFMPETGVTMLDDIWNTGEYAKGGRIHIKPENRGKFTALKKRTGKSASWFKAHGTPAQKKMATFALNARKWKHGLGGNLYDGESEESQQMETMLSPHVELASTNPWLYSKLHPAKDRDEKYEPTTFAGRVSQVVDGNDLTQKYVDYTSSVIQQIPGIGIVPSALDLGYDLNRMYHNPSISTTKDVALDVASLLPALRKTLKGWWMKGNSGTFVAENGQTFLNPRVASALEVALQPYRNAVNTGIYAGRAADFLDDSKGFLKEMYNDSAIGRRFPIKADGGYLNGPIVEAANIYEEAGPIEIDPKDTKEKSNYVPNIFRRPNGEYFYQASPGDIEVPVKPVTTTVFDNPALWTYVDDFGKYYTPKGKDTGTVTKTVSHGPIIDAINKYVREGQYRINDGSLLLQGKYAWPLFGLAATGIGSAIDAPFATAASMIEGSIGDYAVDKLSSAFTGSDWATNVSNLTGLDKSIARFTNPGMIVGGQAGYSGAKTVERGVAQDRILGRIHTPEDASKYAEIFGGNITDLQNQTPIKALLNGSPNLGNYYGIFNKNNPLYHRPNHWKKASSYVPNIVELGNYIVPFLGPGKTVSRLATYNIASQSSSPERGIIGLKDLLTKGKYNGLVEAEQGITSEIEKEYPGIDFLKYYLWRNDPVLKYSKGVKTAAKYFKENPAPFRTSFGERYSLYGDIPQGKMPVESPEKAVMQAIKWDATPFKTEEGITSLGLDRMINAHKYDKKLSPIKYDKWSSIDDWWNSDVPRLNVGGHQVYIDSNSGEVLSRDIWKFNPWDWNNRWTGLGGVPSQAGILDKLGTPFITTSENRLSPEALFYLNINK